MSEILKRLVVREDKEWADIGLMLPSTDATIKATIYRNPKEAENDELFISDGLGGVTINPTDLPELIAFCQKYLAMAEKRDYPEGVPEVKALTEDEIERMAAGIE